MAFSHSPHKVSIGTLIVAGPLVTAADEMSRNDSGIAERSRFRRLMDVDEEVVRDLRVMVPPFAEVTFLAGARAVTDRAGLAGRNSLPASPEGLPHAIRRRRARMRGTTPTAKPNAFVLTVRAAKPFVAIERRDLV
jgi:hypothetical protein